MTDTPTDLNRAIAERLGWRVELQDDTWMFCRPQKMPLAILPAVYGEEMAWGQALNRWGTWTEDIGAVLALVEPYRYTIYHEPRGLPHDPDITTRVIILELGMIMLIGAAEGNDLADVICRAWLDAQEAKRERNTQV